MAFTVQDDSGTVAGANAYVTVAYFKSYHTDRGGNYGSASDPDIQKAIIKATDYLDQRFRFRGSRAHTLQQQNTQWPRLDVVDDDGNWVNGVPDPVKRACAEYALRALTTPLNPDPVRIDDTGLAVNRVLERVGPITEEKWYFQSSTAQLPKYPAADRLMVTAGLIAVGSQLTRG